jgi:hypothetical protein
MAEPRWDDAGYWVGPRDLGVFLRSNRFYVGFNLVVITGIALALWVDVADLSMWFAVPLALATGIPATLGLMFAFSRGWIADDD